MSAERKFRKRDKQLVNGGESGNAYLVRRWGLVDAYWILADNPSVHFLATLSIELSFGGLDKVTQVKHYVL